MSETKNQELLALLQGETPAKQEPGEIVLRYGKHKGKTLDEMMETKDTISYLMWVQRTTTSEFMRRSIKEVADRKIQSLKKQ